MEKNTFDWWKKFSTMHSFWVFFFFWKIFTFFGKFSQVAIFKLEHCSLFYLVAYGWFHNSLYFESDHLNYFWKKIEKPKFSKNLDFGFRKVYGRSTKFSKWETKNTWFCFGINKLSNAKKKKRNVLPSKLRPVKTFKVWKKQNFSGEHLKDDKQLALPPRRPKHGLRFLNSTAPAWSRVSAQLSS